MKFGKVEVPDSLNKSGKAKWGATFGGTPSCEKVHHEKGKMICPINLDQTDVTAKNYKSGSCGGFPLIHAAATISPSNPQPRSDLTEEDAFAVLRRAQEIDCREGSDYLGIMNIRYIMQAGIDLGYISRYIELRTFDEMVDALEYVGPVVLGVTMFPGMSQPDSFNYIGVLGKRWKKNMKRHAFCAIGNRTWSKKNFWSFDWNWNCTFIKNSWPRWGKFGEVMIGNGCLKWLFKKGYVQAYLPIVSEG
jgi:hypothetical protein